jgi:hypothetical protein
MRLMDKLTILRAAAVGGVKRWRVLFTDTESESGVGLVCDSAEHPFAFPTMVYDCCPGLQFDTFSVEVAAYIVMVLNLDTDEAAIEWLASRKDCTRRNLTGCGRAIQLEHCEHYQQGDEGCCYCDRRSPRKQVKDNARFYTSMQMVFGGSTRQERLPGGES